MQITINEDYICRNFRNVVFIYQRQVGIEQKKTKNFLC